MNIICTRMSSKVVINARVKVEWPELKRKVLCRFAIFAVIKELLMNEDQQIRARLEAS